MDKTDDNSELALRIVKGRSNTKNVKYATPAGGFPTGSLAAITATQTNKTKVKNPSLTGKGKPWFPISTYVPKQQSFRSPAQINLLPKKDSSKNSTVWYIFRVRNDVEYFLCDVDESTGQRTWSKNIDDNAYIFTNEKIAKKVWESLGEVGMLVEVPVST